MNFSASRASYDADPGLNQSKLKLFHGSKTPAHFKYDDSQKDDKSHFRIGNAIDQLCFQPEKFKESFIVWEGDRRAGNEWKAFKAAADLAGLTILSKPELEQVKGMVEGLRRCEDAANIIANSHRQVAVISEDPLLKVRKKGLLDFFPDIHSEWIFDLKSTGLGADHFTFSKQAADLGYDMQAAFYLDLCREQGMTQCYKFGFIVIESFPPYECAIHFLQNGDEETERGRKRYKEAIVKHQECVASGKWPGYPSAWTRIKFPKWAFQDRSANLETIS